jgi:hypothetical protein
VVFGAAGEDPFCPEYLAGTAGYTAERLQAAMATVRPQEEQIRVMAILLLAGLSSAVEVRV